VFSFHKRGYLPDVIQIMGSFHPYKSQARLSAGCDSDHGQLPSVQILRCLIDCASHARYNKNPTFCQESSEAAPDCSSAGFETLQSIGQPKNEYGCMPGTRDAHLTGQGALREL
jgi:hypothetical protein